MRRYAPTSPPGCNAATAAAALRVDRHTVERRLNSIETRLGRSLHTCRAELEVALRLEELGDSGDAGPAGPDTALTRGPAGPLGPDWDDVAHIDKALRHIGAPPATHQLIPLM